MSSTIPIVINGTTIQLPNSGASPNWSQAVIQAFQQIAKALAISTNSFDIPPQLYIMTSNVNTNVDIPNLSFPTNKVNGSIILYNCARHTNSTDVSESGILMLNYDSSLSSGQKWQLSKEFVNAGAQISFDVTDLGQVQFSTTSIAGSGHTGSIYFRSLTVLNNS